MCAHQPHCEVSMDLLYEPMTDFIMVERFDIDYSGAGCFFFSSLSNINKLYRQSH